ncbi:MAG: phosphoglycerate dehydrogenase related dehydrogenase [halophilic archaeon J07HX5]|nr:MAG: phosphoglycerate dehydrogenase related dehydrogenase [halophilic archaeon J07HX5]
MRILVLRGDVHGMDTPAYASAIRDRLPEADVEVAVTPADERSGVRSARVVTGHAPPPQIFETDGATPELFACLYAGTDHLDLDALAAADIAVTNAAGVHGPNIAEYVLGGILAHAQGFLQARSQQRTREWRSYQTSELSGATVAVVGLGAIGQAVADRLAAFDAETVGVRYTPEKGGPTDTVYGFDEIHAAVADTEYVVLACPLTEATEAIVDAELFETMAPRAVVVNVARGGVVDTDALVAALRWNSIGGAVLDVTDPEPLPADHPLWRLDNVLITPHNAGHTPAYYERRADILTANVAALEQGDPLQNRVR